MPAKVIVFGNEKGGTGKSTLAMHVAVALLARGLKIATIDLDAGQGTLTRYVANRRAYLERGGQALAMPHHDAILPAAYQDADAAELTKALGNAADMDAVIIDTPGHDTPLSLAGHSYADIIVTPLNDSLIDLDVLADVDARKRTIARPSRYAERVWKAKQLRARRDGGKIDWIVVRNRLGQLDAKNKRLMGQLLADLAKRIGCRLGQGIAERVIYRELFLDGLTVEDLAALSADGQLAMSHVAARAEVRALLQTMGLPDAAG
ncbi:MAG: division plane positioning ATPase MipZ [Rhodospirillaceae bacterium]|nr:division plane positioning ATPase MipZ [Rhodospirillaceae bacterium]